MIYTICTPTRNFLEINDFVEYHLNIGFDRIVLYDNLSTPPVKIDDNRVNVIRWEHELISCNAFNDYISKNNQLEGWTAFIDEDEFINTNNKNIKEVMNEFQDFDSLSLSWRLFGDRIDDEFETKFWKKYKYHIPNNHDINYHTKIICKNDAVKLFSNPHYPSFKDGKKSKNVKGQIVDSPFSIPIHEKIWIDHFHCRGLDDYVKRKSIKINNTCPTIEQIIESYNHHNLLAINKL
jgi:hypothetical protein